MKNKLEALLKKESSIQELEDSGTFSLDADELKIYRMILWVGIIALPFFGLVYEFTNADAIDFFSHRLIISGIWLAVFLLTYSKNPFIQKNILLFVYACYYILSYWVLWIVGVNNFSEDYMIGLMLTFTCIIAVHRHPWAMQLYIFSFVAITLVSTLALGVLETSKLLIFSTMVTIGAVMYIIMVARTRAERNLIKLNNLLAREVLNKQKIAGELERSNQELDKFASIASHDLQAPLRKINSFVERLISVDKDKLSEKGLFYLERVKYSVNKMQNLITALLKYSRLEGATEKDEVVNLNEIVAEVVQSLEPEIEKSDAEINTTPLPTIKTNRMFAIQLFQNLIGNALKFRRAEVKPVIGIEYKKNGEDNIHIVVKDNGLGISREFNEKIFRPFERLHGVNEYEGSGIGLAICKKIVDREGGKIWVESEPGRGSEFHILLPNENLEAPAELIANGKGNLK